MHDHHEHGHQHMIKSREEAVAFLQYTLKHNEHHGEELEALAHSLEHLGYDSAAKEIRLCMQDYEKGNRRMTELLSELGK